MAEQFATRTTRPAYSTQGGTADTPVWFVYSQIHFVNPLFTSRIKGNWEKYTEVAERAPPGWKKQHGMTVQVCDAENPDTIPTDTDSVEVSAYKKAWARTQGRAVTQRVTTRHDYFQGCMKSIRLLSGSFLGLRPVVRPCLALVVDLK